MSADYIRRLVRSWQLSELSALSGGATDADLENAERSLGQTLPQEFWALYGICNGGDVVDGNIQLYPLEGSSELSVVQAAGFLRRMHWSLPDTLVVFAGDGCGGNFGLLLSSDRSVAPVLEIQDGGVATITGTSLARFLWGRTAYYLLICNAPESSLDELAVPEQFRERREELGDEDYAALLSWADPMLAAFRHDRTTPRKR